MKGTSALDTIDVVREDRDSDQIEQGGLPMRRSMGVLLIGVLALAASACGSDSATTSSTDDGGGVSVPASDAGTAVAVEAGDTSDTVQYLTVSVASVPAGPVTFTLTNNSNVGKKHEMVVLKTDTPYDQLEVGADDRVSEADSVGEISEIEPGTTGTVTLDLEPGKYVLVCNLAKHYAQGMRAAFTVE
jgi:uncharacterized cupredoxin-like copper-binding protein